MDKFIIEGGKSLSGTVRPSGSKNEALPGAAAPGTGAGEPAGETPPPRQVGDPVLV